MTVEECVNNERRKQRVEAKGVERGKRGAETVEPSGKIAVRSEEHTSELQSRDSLGHVIVEHGSVSGIEIVGIGGQ